MNSKERVLATFRGEPTDRTPLDCMLYQRNFVDMLKAEYGSREKFYEEFNIDIFDGFVPWPNQLGRKIGVEDLAGVDLGDPLDRKWVDHRIWSDDFSGNSVVHAVENYSATHCVGAHIWGILEGTSSFLGIEDCWANLALEPELMTNWFDRYADWLCGEIENCKRVGVDYITLSDDWGSNGNMLFSPRMWRKRVKPYTMRVAQHAKSLGIPINLHSDGYIMDIMDDVIEMGFVSLHPVQESAGMDPHLIKEQYGDKLTVYGSLDVVDGLYGNDGEDLDAYITRHFEIYAPGGRFLFCTGHFVQPDIPVKRLLRAYTLANELAVKYGTL
jgi:uroporphyrinogen decarboxylase